MSAKKSTKKVARKRVKRVVADATRGMVLHITKTDCARGDLKTPSSCAAAKALCRLDGVEAAQVYIGRTYVKQKGKWTRYATPPSLRNEIIAFDRGGSFEPGDYTLRPIQPSLRHENHAQRVEYLARLKEYNATPKRRREKQEQEKLREHRRLRKSGHVVKNIRQRAGWGPDLGK